MKPQGGWLPVGHVPMLPSDVSRATFSFSDMEVKVPHVNFFYTTNILAPGKNVISVDEKQGIFIPYDVLLVGQVLDPTPNLLGVSPGANAIEKPTAFDLINEFRNNETLLVNLIKALISQKYDDALDLFSSRGYQLEDADFDKLDVLYLPGAEFDIRMFGGAYRVTSGTVPFKEFIVDAISGIVSARAANVVGQSVDLSKATLTFKTDDGTNTHNVIFHREKSSDESEPDTFTFSGTTYPTSSPSQAQTFFGVQYFPVEELPKVELPKSSSVDDGDATITADPPNKDKPDWFLGSGAVKLGLFMTFVSVPQVQRLGKYVFRVAKDYKFPTNLKTKITGIENTYMNTAITHLNNGSRLNPLTEEQRRAIIRSSSDDLLHFLNKNKLLDPIELQQKGIGKLEGDIKSMLHNMRLAEMRRTLENYKLFNDAAKNTAMSESSGIQVHEEFKQKDNGLSLTTLVHDQLTVILIQESQKANKTALADLAKEIAEGKANLDKLASESDKAEKDLKEAKDEVKRGEKTEQELEEFQKRFDEAKKKEKQKSDELADKVKDRLDQEKRKDDLEKEKKDADKKLEDSKKKAEKRAK